MIVKSITPKKCSSCGSRIEEYDTDKNVDWQGFLHCDKCLSHCTKNNPYE